MALCAVIITSNNAFADEDNNENNQAPLRSYNTNVSGNFNVKTWLTSNSVDQFITLNTAGNNKSFINSKQAMTMIGLESNYWFGFITQNQLWTLGPQFGVGFDFAYGKNSFSNVSVSSDQPVTADLITYLLDISFVKLALLHDEKMSKYIALTGHYISYSNSLSGSSPLNGLGVGIDSQYNFDDIADLNFKLNYIPSASSIRLPNAWGAQSELGLKWFLSPRAAVNVSYKAIYFNGTTSGQANVPTGTTGANGQQQTTPVSFNINLSDILHGLNIGASYYF
ncbi:MAG: hypothetical protein U0354_13785 [Candidatus Sericytochromatia bacterium]